MEVLSVRLLRRDELSRRFGARLASIAAAATIGIASLGAFAPAAHAAATNAAPPVASQLSAKDIADTLLYGSPQTTANTPANTPPAGLPSMSASIFASHPRVGIQAGHWLSANLPDELSVLRTSTGAEGSGWKEVDVNLDIAQRVASLLSQQGIQVDLLPSTVPSDYSADAFVALHGDSNSSGRSGYKLARSIWSIIPDKDDTLLRDIGAQYRSATGLKEDLGTITDNMTQYYAFNNQKYQHTVDPSTPSVIVEMGFLSNAADQQLLTERQDVAAQAIASGIVQFLDRG